MKHNIKITGKKLNEIFEARLNDENFKILSEFIQDNYGIKMPKAKRIMLQSRLQKRLRILGITSYEKYIKFVFSPAGNDEIINMIDAVSTNKTDFFREPAHFEFMKKTLLKKYLTNKNDKYIKVWSAGCSTGEEPYTIAIVLSEFIRNNFYFDFSIFGTDISTHALKIARDAIYSEERVDVINIDLKRKYLLKSKDKSKKLIRIVPSLRNKVRYKRLNFMDNDYKVREKFDIIFCRNVLIYFDRENQEKVINKLCNNLKIGGWFFFGHSESITGIDVPLEHIQPTIFRKIN